MNFNMFKKERFLKKKYLLLYFCCGKITYFGCKLDILQNDTPLFLPLFILDTLNMYFANQWRPR